MLLIPDIYMQCNATDGLFLKGTQQGCESVWQI